MNEILIVGAGIAGLSLARQLAKHHIAFDIIEKRPAPVAIGAAIALPANAMRALDYMGLADKVCEQAHQVSEIIYAKPSGKYLSQASLLEKSLSKNPFVALTRAQLHNILADGLINKVITNTDIASMQQRDDSVLVEFTGTQLKPKIYSAVIGADGIHSRVRQLTFGDVELVDLNATNWRWICDYPTDNLQPTYMLGAQDAF